MNSNNQQNNSGGVKFGKGFKQAGSNQADNKNYQQPAGQQNYQTQGNGQAYGQNYNQVYNTPYAYSNSSAVPHEKDTRNIFELYKQFWKKCVVFKGCASRREYWMTVLMNMIINLILFAISMLGQFYFMPLWYIMRIVILSYWMASFVAGTALCTRRLHDTGRSGHWQWLNLTIYGSIAVLVFICQKSKYENNKYRN